MYVDAIYAPNESVVKVVERVNGKRVFVDYPAIYEFYTKDPNGRHKSIYGDSLSRITCNTDKEFKQLKRIHSHKQKFESDIKPLNKVLEAHYLNKNTPTTNNLFFDIETAFDQELGYSDPEDANNPIISVAVHLQWLNQTVCLALAPDTVTTEQAQQIADTVGNTIICGSESELLQSFLLLVEDADIISGWNSEGYDIPYTVNRIFKVLGRNESRKLCLWGQLPSKREYVRGGKTAETYDLTGRIHFDYLQLYKKFTYEERHSYSLDNIAEAELGEKKVEYDGTLDELYHNDFQKFIEYNIQDTLLLDRIDKKLQYIELAITIAHSACVLLPAAMGAVAVTENAIICEAHSKGLRVPDKSYKKNEHSVFDEEFADLEDKAAGGWVQTPKKGLHKWIGSADLNSLYPSVIRACNMSPETIVGQVRTTETDTEILKWVSQPGAKRFMTEWWNDRFNVLEMEYFYDADNVANLTLDMEDNQSIQLSGAELRQLVFNKNNNWCITANGTIFKTDQEGIIPALLTRWYFERQQMQRVKKDYGSLVNGIQLDNNLTFTPTEEGTVDGYSIGEVFSVDALKNTDDLESYLTAHSLYISDGLVKHQDADTLNKLVSFWDKRQLVRKISLNSVYGGLLNVHCRFYDKRIGQSTTLTGRSITKHMAAKTNEILDGSYDHEGRASIGGDTDSVAHDSLIRISRDNETVQNTTIEELFLQGNEYWESNGKEYSLNSDIKIAHTGSSGVLNFVNYNYVYRHKVKNKARYRVTTSNGKSVVVTDDHSVMIMQDGCLIEKKPSEIKQGDLVITIVDGEYIKSTGGLQEIDVKVSEVVGVERLDDFDDEYVYDIGVANDDPYFFANDILVHNSVYFSAYPVLRKEIDNGEIVWDKDTVIELYDTVSAEVSSTFPQFMLETFNVPFERGKVIKSAREVVGETGLFIKKKRYAIMVYDDEGQRKDVDGKPGKMKITGLDLRRSDTPKVVQEFLKQVLELVLTNRSEDEVIEFIRTFKDSFSRKKPWEKGSPKAVNNLSKYGSVLENYLKKKSTHGKIAKPTIPGHVMASINWNTLRDRYHDRHSTRIVDGQKIVVCPLKDNNDLRMSSIAYPVDETHLPEWFTKLPFDEDAMMQTVVDKKIENLLSILGWDLSRTSPEVEHMESLFDFG